MEMQQLKRFLVVSETLNFHAAAEKLNITQPALSQSIKKLEQSVGELLFLRGTRGVELTEAGELLIPRAKLILKFRNEFETDIGVLQSIRNSRISVGVAPYFVRRLFPEALASFCTKAPGIHIDIREQQTSPLIEAIEHGEIDIAFCATNQDVEARPTVEFEKLYIEKYSLVARAGHPIFESGGTQTKALGMFPWAVHDREAITKYFTETFEKKNCQVPEFTITTNSLQIIVSLVCKSDHIALVANDFAFPELQAGIIKKIPNSLFRVEAKGGVFTLANAPQSKAVKLLIDELRQVCASK